MLAHIVHLALHIKMTMFFLYHLRQSAIITKEVQAPFFRWHSPELWNWRHLVLCFPELKSDSSGIFTFLNPTENHIFTLTILNFNIWFHSLTNYLLTDQVITEFQQLESFQTVHSLHHYEITRNESVSHLAWLTRLLVLLPSSLLMLLAAIKYLEATPASLTRSFIAHFAASHLRHFTENWII